MRVFFRHTARFRRPVSALTCHFMFRESLLIDTKYENMSTIFIRLLGDKLSEIAYDMQQASLTLDYSGTDYGIAITVVGYSSVISRAISLAHKTFFEYIPSKERFEFMKASLLQDMSSSLITMPIRLAVGNHENLIDRCPHSVIVSGMLTSDLSYESFLLFLKEVRSQLRAEILVLGNETRDSALQLACQIVGWKGEHPTALTRQQRMAELASLTPTDHRSDVQMLFQRLRSLHNPANPFLSVLTTHLLEVDSAIREDNPHLPFKLLPANETYQVNHCIPPSETITVYDDINPNPGDPNGAVCVTFAAPVSGSQFLATSSTLGLFLQLVEQQFYDILRTKEQLGYIVSSFVSPSSTLFRLSVAVQGDRFHVPHIHSRIIAVTRALVQHVLEMPDEEIYAAKSEIVKTILHPPTNLAADVRSSQKHFFTGIYDWLSSYRTVSYLTTLTAAEFKERIQAFFGFDINCVPLKESTSSDSSESSAAFSESKPEVFDKQALARRLSYPSASQLVCRVFPLQQLSLVHLPPLEVPRDPESITVQGDDSYVYHPSPQFKLPYLFVEDVSAYKASLDQTHHTGFV